MSYSKGICWISDCRIPFVDEGDTFMINKLEYQGKDWYKEGCEYKGIKEYNTQGRFTPNLLVCDDMLNDGSVGKSNGNIRNNKKPQNIYGNGKGFPPCISTSPNDSGSNSRYYDLDKWFDNMIDSL